MHEEALVPCARARAEDILLAVGDGLDKEARDEEDGADDVAGGAEVWDGGVAGDAGGVEDGDGEGDSPYPEHLEEPETKEFEEVVAYGVEAAVFAGFEDAEEEEAGETGTPEYEEYGSYDVLGCGQRVDLGYWVLVGRDAILGHCEHR